MRKFIFEVLALAGGFILAAGQAAMPVPAAGKTAEEYPQEIIMRGEILAAEGNCASCHTKPGGKDFAGGLGLRTPFGVVYSTNITPDQETGIGRWPEAAFTRALRQGIGLNGEHLYPVFPYDHFTRLSDADTHALYAYVMTRPPVKSNTPANELSFPFSFRPAIAIWKLLFFNEGRYEPDSAHDAEWNRGAYLAEGLAHCGACHTPRNVLGAEESTKAYDGAAVEGWYAYAINGASPAPVPWTKEAIAFYLSRGWHPDHGMARGPMAPVVMNLATVPKSDVDAIAAYIASHAPPNVKTPGELTAESAARVKEKGAKLVSADSLANVNKPAGTKEETGAAIYAGACAVCHQSGRPLPFGGVDLHLSTAVSGPTPANIINVTLFGLPQHPGLPSAVMPGFRASLTDEQMTALLRYLRSAFATKQPAWQNIEEEVRNARRRRPEIWPAPPARPVVANNAQETAPW